MHQLADRREDGGDSAIVLSDLFVQSRLELREAASQFADVSAQRLNARYFFPKSFSSSLRDLLTSAVLGAV